MRYFGLTPPLQFYKRHTIICIQYKILLLDSVFLILETICLDSFKYYIPVYAKVAQEFFKAGLFYSFLVDLAIKVLFYTSRNSLHSLVISSFFVLIFSAFLSLNTRVLPLGQGQCFTCMKFDNYEFAVVILSVKFERNEPFQITLRAQNV